MNVMYCSFFFWCVRQFVKSRSIFKKYRTVFTIIKITPKHHVQFGLKIQRNELDIERIETLIITETFDFTDENTKLTFSYLHFFPFHNERVFLCGRDESLLNEAVALRVSSFNLNKFARLPKTSTPQPSQVLLPTFEL